MTSCHNDKIDKQETEIHRFDGICKLQLKSDSLYEILFVSVIEI